MDGQSHESPAPVWVSINDADRDLVIPNRLVQGVYSYSGYYVYYMDVTILQGHT